MIQKIFYSINLLPYNLVCFPYLLANFVVQRILKSPSVHIWPRNSFVLKNLISGFSDLDFSLYFLGRVEHYTVKQKILNLKKLSFYFPFIGETNVYSSETLDLVKITINPYELKRDPQLNDIIGEIPSFECDKIVYLLRMLDSDQKNLKHFILLRQKKWKYHLDSAGLSNIPADLTFQNILMSINHQVLKFTNFNESSSEIFVNYYQGNFNRIEMDYHLNQKMVLEFMCIFPWQWLGPSFSNDNLKRDCDILLAADPLYLDLFMAQLSWEIWGYIVQGIYLEQNISWESHMLRIKTIVNFLETSSHPKCYQLQKVLEQLK